VGYQSRGSGISIKGYAVGLWLRGWPVGMLIRRWGVSHCLKNAQWDSPVGYGQGKQFGRRVVGRLFEVLTTTPVRNMFFDTADLGEHAIVCVWLAPRYEVYVLPSNADVTRECTLYDVYNRTRHPDSHAVRYDGIITNLVRCRGTCTVFSGHND
jgi:hypothetical protein